MAFSLLCGSFPSRGSSSKDGTTKRMSIAAWRPSVMTDSRMSSPLFGLPLRCSMILMRLASTFWYALKAGLAGAVTIWRLPPRMSGRRMNCRRSSFSTTSATERNMAISSGTLTNSAKRVIGL